jgi:hypothetical protein
MLEVGNDNILHTHCETIVCEFSSVDKVELPMGPKQSEGEVTKKLDTDLVVWHNFALPSGAPTHKWNFDVIPEIKNGFWVFSDELEWSDETCQSHERLWTKKRVAVDWDRMEMVVRGSDESTMLIGRGC